MADDSHTEEALIRWLRSRPGTGALGDDCAVLDLSGPWAVTVDSQIEGVHVMPGTTEEVLARRLLAVNLSDLAAAGARPAHGFLALAATAKFDRMRFFDAFLEASNAQGLELSGGDLAGGDRYHATLTLLGRPAFDGARFLRRHGARPGDTLWLGGPVGLSHLGLRLLQAGGVGDVPSPLEACAEEALRVHREPLDHVRRQLGLGHELASRRRAAALDVSDGLAKDLHRLCEESGVGARVRADALPFSAEARALAKHLGIEPMRALLGGGEDYVLLFALPAAEAAPDGCVAVGEICRNGVSIAEEDGTVRDLPPEGFDHLSSS